MSDERKKFFIDTEFLENGPSFPLILVSIGLVAEDGRELYLVNSDAPLELANDWVRKNVVPHLGPTGTSISKIPSIIREWIGDCKPEFWGYYADYDWVVFCQLFGTMIDLPKGWPMYCRDLKQLCNSVGNPQLPDQYSTEHNALNDARWNKVAYDFLQSKGSELSSARAELAKKDAEIATWKRCHEQREKEAIENAGLVADMREDIHAKDAEIERLREAANKLIDYCDAHGWGTMPEPFDSINPLLELLGRK